MMGLVSYLNVGMLCCDLHNVSIFHISPSHYCDVLDVTLFSALLITELWKINYLVSCKGRKA